MSKPFDYSKWDNIELSDDEDDVHPNIDKDSWFRLKHRSRVEREDKEEKDKKKINEEVSLYLVCLGAYVYIVMCFRVMLLWFIMYTFFYFAIRCTFYFLLYPHSNHIIPYTL